MPISITPFYAGIAGVIFGYLSLRVVGQRRKLKVSIGDGTIEIIRAVAKDPLSEKEETKKYLPLVQAIRAHANFSEFVPFLLLQIAFLEANGVSNKCVHGLGVTLIGLRLLHFVGLGVLPVGKNAPRFVGTLGTFLLVLGTSGYNAFLGAKRFGLL